MQKRDSLALVLGLSKARVIDVHRGAASRLYLDFVQGKLQQNWMLDADDNVSLKVSKRAGTLLTFSFVCLVVLVFRGSRQMYSCMHAFMYIISYAFLYLYLIHFACLILYDFMCLLFFLCIV